MSRIDDLSSTNRGPAPLLGVVLAAGAGSRMGTPKALLRLPDGRTLAQAWVDALRPHMPVVVVLGAASADLQGARLVFNEAWASTGAMDSLRLGLAGHRGAAVVSPVDVPPPAAGELALLLATEPPACLGHGGAPGHPLLLGPAEVEAALDGRLPTLRAVAARVVEGAPERVLNLNTPADLRAWLSPGGGGG